ncbi:MAG: NAD(P)/FAD-dependent oxidoreductase [Bacteriovorax sp.]|nr:NAD(P)/FAD-dependent oxidoreductase [Bacteriovorax sp.]
MKTKKNVVIIGGGFGGLKAAKVLGAYPDLVNVTLIDRRNYHLFQPLLYQVATAALSPADIAAPIRALVSQFINVNVLLSDISIIDPQNKTIIGKELLLKYDYLILACGATHSYFGNDEWEEFAPGLKTLEMATEIRRRILMAFESAEKEIDPIIQKVWLTFVIVGGGPTGVELAGSISEIARLTLEADFRNINPVDSQIILIEAGERVLASFQDELSIAARIDLEKIGVTVLTKTMVTNIDGNGVKLKHSELESFIPSKTVIWAAGVKASPINLTLGTPLDKAGRLIVEANLSLPNHQDIFVVGDQAHFDLPTGLSLPGLASVAIQQGGQAAHNIILSICGIEMKKFHYFDKGQMATIGRKLAVMEFRGFKARGLFAWIAWLFVHIYYLIGFKNRFIVMFNWAWSYFTFGRGARLITKKDWRDS